MRFHDLLRRAIKKKLKDPGGEALAEVLIALAIAAVGMVLLAGMIMSSADIIKHSKDAVNNYVKGYEDEHEITWPGLNGLAQQDESVGTEGSVTFSKIVNLSGTETTANFVLTDERMEVGGDPRVIPVLYYVNRLGQKYVVSYHRGSD